MDASMIIITAMVGVQVYMCITLRKIRAELRHIEFHMETTQQVAIRHEKRDAYFQGVDASVRVSDLKKLDQAI